MTATSRRPEAGKRSDSRLAAVRSRYGHVIRAWIVFVVSTAVLIQILIWARPFTDTVLTRWIAYASAAILNALGVTARVQGTVIISSLGSLEIIRECTAVYPTAMYVAAVLAFPCSRGRKLLGIVGGIVTIQLANFARIVSLCYIHRWYPEYFMTAHLVVWQSLILFLTVLIWVVWATELSGRRSPHAA